MWIHCQICPVCEFCGSISVELINCQNVCIASIYAHRIYDSYHWWVIRALVHYWVEVHQSRIPITCKIKYHFGTSDKVNKTQSSNNSISRIYVMRYLPNLECLDDIKITDDLRDIVKAHDSKTNQINLNFSKIYPSTPNLKTIWRYDTKTQRSISIQGNIFENLNQMFNSNRHYNWIEFFRFL